MSWHGMVCFGMGITPLWAIRKNGLIYYKKALDANKTLDNKDLSPGSITISANGTA